MHQKENEYVKSFLIYLSVLLFGLLIIDKSLDARLGKNPEYEIEKEFKKTKKQDKIIKPDFNQANEKVKLSFFENFLSKKDEKSYKDVPILDDNNFTHESYSKESDVISIYYVKFYGQGRKVHSRLVRVQKKGKSSLKKNIKLIFKYLVNGPNDIEKQNGLLTAIPSNFKIYHKARLQNGILYLSFNESLQKSIGEEILRDRIDQIVFSLLDIPKIKGVKIYINDKPIKQSGQFFNSDIFVKNDRRVMYF